MVDSAAILELVVWYEDAYQMPLKQKKSNIDNLGSINAMADFAHQAQGWLSESGKSTRLLPRNRAKHSATAIKH